MSQLYFCLIKIYFIYPFIVIIITNNSLHTQFTVTKKKGFVNVYILFLVKITSRNSCSFFRKFGLPYLGVLSPNKQPNKTYEIFRESSTKFREIQSRNMNFG